MNARDRRWTRIEALVIAVVLTSGALVWITTGEHGAPPFAGGLDKRIRVQPRLSAPAAIPAQGPPMQVSAGEQPGSVVPVRYERNGSSSPKTGPAPQPTRAPQPSPSPTSSVTGVWTNCHSVNGMLACKGNMGKFTCTTARTGNTACKGTDISFSCSTDTSTGARQCSSGSDSWQCVTNADTKSTGCAGPIGSYSCSPDPHTGAAERCTGIHSFSCYDQGDGRNCGTTTRSDPDCYFEPVFGAYCRT